MVREELLRDVGENSWREGIVGGIGRVGRKMRMCGCVEGSIFAGCIKHGL